MKIIYNLVLIPAKGKIREIRISSFLLRTAIAFLFIFFFIMGYLTFDYIGLKSNLSTYNKVVIENQDLYSQNIQLEKNLDHMRSQLDSLKDFNLKLKLLVGLTGDTELEGTGGPYSSYRISEDNLEQLNLRRGEIIDSFQRDISIETHKFIKLRNFMNAQHSLLAATPSIWPCKGFLSRGFGYKKDPFTANAKFHQGIDIAGPVGTPIVATADGIISRCEYNEWGYGLLIEVQHGYGYSTRYGHLTKMAVSLGDRVKRGQIIGYRGNTGRSTGPHLHYEVRINNVPVNPMNYILE